MEFDPHDQDIIKLLTKLKGINPEYPANLRAARRQSFLKRIAELELGLSGGPKIKHRIPPHVPPVAGLLEAALLAVIVIEASAMAYFYRAKVADFFQTFTKGPKAEEVTPPPAVPTPLQVQGVSPSPVVTSTVIVENPSETAIIPTSTPIPAMAGQNSSNTPGAPSLKSTPDPKGNNGHHYGQTPKPERTKEKKGNNDKNGNPPGNNNDQPPKDKPPKNK